MLVSTARTTMKRYFFLFLLGCLTSVYGNVGKKTICLNMIVKDESEVIERCLESVKPIIDTWVIVDTGSTDGTQKIIKKYLKKIPGKLYNRPWINFEHNRNEALKLAQGKADYILIMDADDLLRFAKDFQLPSLEQELYFFEFDYNGTRYKRPQLIKSGLPWKWVGVLHEYLDYNIAKSTAVLEGVTYVELKEGNRSCDPKKYIKDIKVLKDALDQDPNNARYAFYLAQSYRDAGQKEHALDAYAQRASMGGWDEEVFYSLYSVAKLKDELEKPYQEVVDSYTKAYLARPTRAEPLYHLALYFRNKSNFLMGYLTAKRARELKQPHDLLFVESWIYEWGLLMEQSVCAYWIGSFQECMTLSKEILNIPNLPDHVKTCTESNIEFALAKLKEQFAKAM